MIYMTFYNLAECAEQDIEKYLQENQEVDPQLWGAISLNPNISEIFIEKYANKVNWTSVSAIHKLSEDFIERHADKVDWEYISLNQTLSEKIIEKYANKVDWSCISEC